MAVWRELSLRLAGESGGCSMDYGDCATKLCAYLVAFWGSAFFARFKFRVCMK